MSDPIGEPSPKRNEAVEESQLLASLNANINSERNAETFLDDFFNLCSLPVYDVAEIEALARDFHNKIYNAGATPLAFVARQLYVVGEQTTKADMLKHLMLMQKTDALFRGKNARK